MFNQRRKVFLNNDDLLKLLGVQIGDLKDKLNWQILCEMELLRCVSVHIVFGK